MQKKYFYFHTLTNNKNQIILGLFKKDELTWTNELKRWVLDNAVCVNCQRKINKKNFSSCKCGKKFIPHGFFLCRARNYLENPINNYVGQYYLCADGVQEGVFIELIKNASRKIHDKNSSARRKDRINNIEGEYTLEDIGWLKNIQKHCCYYCGASEKKLQVEHTVPVSRGGTNFISNIVLACPKCNVSKHSKTDLEFWKYLKKQHPSDWIKQRKTQANIIRKLKRRA